MLCLDCLLRGHIAEARRWAQRLIALGRERDFPVALAMGHGFLAWSAVVSESYQEAVDIADGALALTKFPIAQITLQGARGAAMALSGRTAEGLRVLNEVNDKIVNDGFLGMLQGTEVPHGVAMVLDGDWAAGIRRIEAAIERFSKWGAARSCAWAHFALGEIYFQMATSRARTPLSVLARNARFVVCTLPFASRRAERHYREAERLARSSGADGFLAQSLVGLGALDTLRGRSTQARERIAEAHGIARSLGWPQLEARIAANLDALS